MKLLNKCRNFSSDLILIGKIVGLHGIKGVLKVNVFTENMHEYALLNSFILKSPDGLEERVVSSLWKKQYKKNIFRFLFTDIDSIDSAKSIVGFLLYIKKAYLPILGNDTYFWSDLIGLSIKTKSGDSLGFLSQIIRTGANDVYVIKKNLIGNDRVCKNEILIPAIKSVILEVDLSNKVMYVKLPEGLVD